MPISCIELLVEALKYYGIKEIPGPDHNASVVDFFHEIGYDHINDDETAWCSAFINYIAQKCGYESSGKLNARSWLDVGNEISLPFPGDIVIFWRGSKDSWTGHVGLYVNKLGSQIYVLGGNQSNQVNIYAYPESKLLGYRRLSKIV